MATAGAPGPVPLLGFGFAGIGIWLISRTEDSTRPEGIGLAVLCGIGFAGFYLCIKQASGGSAVWAAATSRLASLVVTAVILLLTPFSKNCTSRPAVIAAIAGCLDVSGTMVFVRATQTGRLDSAVVLASLYPAVTVALARIFLKEHLSRWRAAGMFATLIAVPLIAVQ
jgi:drug/metabolite transporter (DMT)-like permease